MKFYSPGRGEATATALKRFRCPSEAVYMEERGEATATA